MLHFLCTLKIITERDKAFVASLMKAHTIDHDPTHPRLEAVCVAQLPEVTHHLDARVLYRIFRQVRVMRIAHGKPTHAGVMLCDEALQCTAVAGLRCHNSCCVHFFRLRGCHGLNPFSCGRTSTAWLSRPALPDLYNRHQT